MDPHDHRSTSDHHPLQLPLAKLEPELDADLPTAQKIGYAIADAQLVAAQRGYQQRYSEGIDDFLKHQASEAAWQQAQQWGTHLAAIQIEERRQTLIRVSLRTGAIALPTYSLAILLGFNPFTASMVILPALVTALWFR